MSGTENLLRSLLLGLNEYLNDHHAIRCDMSLGWCECHPQNHRLTPRLPNFGDFVPQRNQAGLQDNAARGRYKAVWRPWALDYWYRKIDRARVLMTLDSAPLRKRQTQELYGIRGKDGNFTIEALATPYHQGLNGICQEELLAR